MKKILNIVVVSVLTMSLFLFNCISNVYAREQLIELGGITLIPDDVITDSVIEVGENYARHMEMQPQTRMDGEVWTIQSPKTVVSHGPIKAAFGDIIPIGESRTKTCAWSVSAGTTVRGYKLSAVVSGSKSISQKGPSSSDKLADKKSATHRAFFSVGYGRLVKYTYRVTQKYSGAYIRTEVRYMYADVSTVSCSQLIQLSGSTVYAENHARTKVRNAGTLTNYKSKFSKIDGTCLYYYNW